MAHCASWKFDIISFSMLTLAPPKVLVYSHNPGEFENENILICHVSGFHPPDITIQLMKDEVEIKGANQTDLAFKQNWHFHLTKTVAFTPSRGQKYSCKVTHGMTVKDYAWGELGSAKMCVYSSHDQSGQTNKVACDAASKVGDEKRHSKQII